ncbi:MAG: hypothetical protein F6K36_30495 [Symploca sp. SIO3C6]|nr:hypothetical protein [Symploca sp. SIO3C6]
MTSIPKSLKEAIDKTDRRYCSYCLTSEVNRFNPRTQEWNEHFAWTLDDTKIQGLTSTGRATVVQLKLNNPLIVEARFRWKINGWHPPDDI